MNAQKLKSKYKKQLKKVTTMLEEFLQPWVILCLEPHEVLSIGWVFLGENHVELDKLESYWDKCIEFEED